MKLRILVCLSALVMVGVAAAPPVSALSSFPAVGSVNSVGAVDGVSSVSTVGAVNAAVTPYIVTMSTPAASMSLGVNMRVTGSVRGGGATRVMLYQRSGARWVPWRAARVVAGRYAVSYRPVAAGPHIIRVVAPATRWHRAGGSPGKTISVYRWHYLSDFTNTARFITYSGNWSPFGEVGNINGQIYLHTLRDQHYSIGETGYVEYNLSRACLVFQMTSGLTDESATGGSAQLEVLTDGVQNWARRMTLGQSQFVSLSVDGGLRLRLQDTIVTRSPSSEIMFPAFGDARVLCRF